MANDQVTAILGHRVCRADTYSYRLASMFTWWLPAIASVGMGIYSVVEGAYSPAIRMDVLAVALVAACIFAFFGLVLNLSYGELINKTLVPSLYFCLFIPTLAVVVVALAE